MADTDDTAVGFWEDKIHALSLESQGIKEWLTTANAKFKKGSKLLLKKHSVVTGVEHEAVSKKEWTVCGLLA